jgi:hypothetical protein
VKQFARCSNCRQWYLERAVTTVDILQGNGVRRTALWCQPCIREAEQRSLNADAHLDDHDLQTRYESLLNASLAPSEAVTGTFGELLQEHLDLMEEALLEENDRMIAMRIGDFMDRSRAHLEQLDNPEQSQRLTIHLNYWQTFLRALES